MCTKTPLSAVVFYLTTYVLAVLTFFGTAETLFSKTLGDRLVIEINSTAHTQREVEVYIVIRESLRDQTKGDQKVALISRENWVLALATYTDDMLVLSEALRLGSFQPADTIISTAVNLFAERLKKDPALKEYSERMGVNNKTLTRNISTILRIEAFKRGQVKQTEGEASSSTAGITDDAGNKLKWFKELEERSVVRKLIGADIYQVINPKGTAK